jgi:hypothetical protein
MVEQQITANKQQIKQNLVATSQLNSQLSSLREIERQLEEHRQMLIPPEKLDPARESKDDSSDSDSISLGDSISDR